MNKKIILLSGVSGAGKSTVSNIFEDLGYHCIDQFPSDIIESLTNYIDLESDSRFDKLLLTTNLLDFKKIYNHLINISPDLIVILLDANKEELLNRYKFTRRIHPLLISNRADSLESAIDIEKEMLLDIYTDTAIKLDTTQIEARKLRTKLENLIKENDKNRLHITFESFGFKYGIIKDADLVFDVRILKNPFYIEKLRNLTGNNQEVYDYVINEEETKIFLNKQIEFLDYIFNQYKNSGKRHITIGTGCTGGKHRSVSVTRYLYNYYKSKYPSFIRHRDEEK